MSADISPANIPTVSAGSSAYSGSSVVGEFDASVFNYKPLHALVDVCKRSRPAILRNDAKKLLVMVAGTKGGVGKTLLCEQLATYYSQVFGLTPRLFDCDTSHLGLSRRLGALEPFSAHTPDLRGAVKVPVTANASPSFGKANNGFRAKVGVYSGLGSSGLKGDVAVTKDVDCISDSGSSVTVARTLQEVVSLLGSSKDVLALADLPAATGANEASITSFLDGLTLNAFDEYGIRVVVIHIHTMSVDSLMASVNWLNAFRDLPHSAVLCLSDRPTPFDPYEVYKDGSPLWDWYNECFEESVIRIPFYDEKGGFNFSKGLGTGVSVRNLKQLPGSDPNAPVSAPLVPPFLLKISAFTNNAAVMGDWFGRDFVSKSSGGQVTAGFDKFRERYRALARKTWGDKDFDLHGIVRTESLKQETFFDSCSECVGLLTLPDFVEHVAKLDEAWSLPIPENFRAAFESDVGRSNLVRFLPHPGRGVSNSLKARYRDLAPLPEVAAAVFASELDSSNGAQPVSDAAASDNSPESGIQLPWCEPRV